MGYTPAVVLNQVIAQLGLAVRDASGVPTYGSSLGDQSYAADELQRGVDSAGTMIMEAICQTEGHEHRNLFTNQTVLTNNEVLPTHYGPIGIPQITPYSGATYALAGKRKSVDQVKAYQANINSRYSLIDHNAATSKGHSKLAGFYAIDGDVVYFTGFSATSMLANFDETDSPLLPDSYHPLGIALAITNLNKDGNTTDIFSYFQQHAMAGLALIRGEKQAQPSMQTTIGMRDSGAK